MTDPSKWPSVAEVEAQWAALIRAEVTREEVHAWTVLWVEGDGLGWHERLGHVEHGLQLLHGYSMAYEAATSNLIHHGPPGEYVKSDEDIAAEFDRWVAQH